MIDLTTNPYYLTKDEIDYVYQQVNQMTVDEKIGQLFFVIGQDENTVNLDEFIDKYKPGGMMFRPGPAKDIKRQIKQIQSRSKYPLFFAANLESGGNGIVNEGTWLGMPMQMAATDNTDAAFQLGSIAGYEANQVGCNMSFAPIVDIDNNFRNPITNTRTFGSDPKRVLRMAQAQRKGLEENQVIPVIKHFPGDGVDERDQHLLSSINSLSADDWSNTYGHIYKTFIDKGISTVMIGHIYQPAWERKLQTGIKDQDLRPASASKLLINGLLRQELGFNGLAMTDATAMVGYNVILSREELLPATINAGVDMILFNKNIDEDYKAITTAVKTGVVSLERLDEAVTRILATKVSQKVLTTDGELGITIPETLTLKTNEYQAITERIAKQSVTFPPSLKPPSSESPRTIKRTRGVLAGEIGRRWSRSLTSVTDCLKKNSKKLVLTFRFIKWTSTKCLKKVSLI